jgi:Leucine-rich repeat (LRR) protein
LQQNQIGNKGAKALANLPHLTDLDLSYNQIGVGGDLTLENLPQGLTYLGLEKNQIRVLAAKPLPKGLTHLNLSRNQIRDKEVLKLAKFLPQSLIILDLSFNKIENDGAIALANCLPWDLTHLDLQGNWIGGKGALTLAYHLHRHKRIISFNLRDNCFISPNEMFAVRNILNDTQILTLNLNNSHF